MDKDSEKLIQALLSKIREDENTEDHIDQSETDFGSEKVRNDTNEEAQLEEEKSDYGWHNLSDVEVDSTDVSATTRVPSFVETLSSDERRAELKAAFQSEFPVNRNFRHKEDAKRQIEMFS
ncbi:hypothetical protein G6F43_008831 [Rhizopus delemar]|nr:hypothetical protein G6F43_008831 [Rhizopus delemar]